MNLRTLWMTLLMIVGMTFSAHATAWSDTGLPGNLPSGWSIAENEESQTPSYGLSISGDPNFDGLIFIVPPSEMQGSLKSTVNALAQGNGNVNRKRISQKYGETIVEMVEVQRGLYFSFAEYKGRVYGFYMMNQKTKMGETYQDELFQYIFGKTK